jgi:hypothetical protein
MFCFPFIFPDSRLQRLLALVGLVIVSPVVLAGMSLLVGYIEHLIDLFFWSLRHENDGR